MYDLGYNYILAWCAAANSIPSSFPQI